MKLSPESYGLLAAAALIIGVTTALSTGPETGGRSPAAATSMRMPVAAPPSDLSPAPAGTVALKAEPVQGPSQDRMIAAEPAYAKQPTAAAAPPPQIPPLPYRYAGQVESEGKKLVLLVRGQQSLIAAVGDVLDGTYRVDEILPAGARLLYLPLNVSQTATAGAIQVSSRPAELLLTVPAQVAAGSTLQAMVGVSPGDAGQSGQLHVSYDVESLQLLDVDSTSGTSMSMLSWTPGVIHLGFDAEAGGAAGSTPIQFLVIAAPGSTQIGLTADGKDSSGNTSPSIRPQRRTVLIRQAAPQEVAAAER